MIAKAMTIMLGGEEVPLLRRDWRSGKRQPLRKTYTLQPGQHWHDAELTPDQWEHYVQVDDQEQIPVGALIARELVNDGASHAVFTELWGGCVLVNQDLVCVAAEGKLGQILDEIREANSGNLGGLPDVMAVFPDGRIAFREAKNVAAKDRLGPKQHEMAKLLRQLYGTRLDLAVVEWELRNERRADWPL